MERTSWTEKEAIEIAIRLCEKNGFEFIRIKRLHHDADYYLRYVMAYSKESQEYATWLLNLSTGGLNYGHYIDHRLTKGKEEAYLDALLDFHNR